MVAYFLNIIPDNNLHNFVISGISSSDQQSLIQPKSILKPSSCDSTRYVGDGRSSYSGQNAASGPMLQGGTKDI